MHTSSGNRLRFMCFVVNGLGIVPVGLIPTNNLKFTRKIGISIRVLFFLEGPVRLILRNRNHYNRTRKKMFLKYFFLKKKKKNMKKKLTLPDWFVQFQSHCP